MKDNTQVNVLGYHSPSKIKLPNIYNLTAVNIEKYISMIQTSFWQFFLTIVGNN